MKVPEPDTAPVATLAELPFYLAERFDRPVLLRRCVAEGFEEFSTREFVDQIRALSLGLRQVGIGPGDRVSLVCESRPEWSITDLAILTAGAVNVPVYPTLSAAQTGFILQDAGVKVVVVSDETQLAKILALAPGLPALTAVIVVVPAAAPAVQPAGGPAVHALRDVVAEGRARVAADASLARQYEAQARRVGAGDVATIIYTSGTTGHPKGVVLTHRNILSNLMAVNAVVQIRGDDAPLSFLPLSHVFERLALYLFLVLGCRRDLRRVAADGVARSRARAADDHDRRAACVREVPPRRARRGGRRPGDPEGAVPLGHASRVGGLGRPAGREAAADVGRAASAAGRRARAP